MSDMEQITLRLSVPEIEQYCADLCRGTSNANRKHATLIALEGFITTHASSDTFSGPFHKIISIIQQYSEQTRRQLLKQYADELVTALSRRNAGEIARIHDSLSRNGFDQILEAALDKLSLTDQMTLKEWAESWSSDAENKALAASGFPDAFNFKGAGIALSDYRAVCELKRKLSPL
ncbi:MAG: hypothetical protein OQK42_02525 [Sedimenticola sp.]|nr:hypothetical protein [Sedimenticola sp.]